MQEESIENKSKRPAEPDIFLCERKHYRGYKWKNISRLTLTYLAPWVLLMIFFFYQYDAITTEGKVFPDERPVGLANLIKGSQIGYGTPSVDGLETAQIAIRLLRRLG